MATISPAISLDRRISPTISLLKSTDFIGDVTRSTDFIDDFTFQGFFLRRFRHQIYWVQLLGTLLTASAHVMAVVIGSGVLSLAWCLAQLGWILGVLLLAAFAVITWFCFSVFSICVVLLVLFVFQ
ncbi:putative amino acid transporter, transmembrane domain-containing protein [Helianthus annuus]|uniref:Amino acid transporter, transmembrane domain-containing protein n=1 Tax=Helianthus annuus TaxID=4232 RepID=A0A9K3EDP0_HELAN|nr:putative amino acid transporter, transmembrane domain-containing protein [Helianthus annuus]KAJ0847842.1 putative amino acid transporter, transmembrane domain-containing protein [Helianthus annuus]